MLAGLAAMTLVLARDLQARALEAATTEEATKLATAFHRVSRGLRQTLALELKVIREAHAQRREAEQSAAAEAAARLLQEETRAKAFNDRRRSVRSRIDDAFWSEHEGCDWVTSDQAEMARFPERPPPGDPMWDRLETFLDEAATEPDFLSRDVDILVIEACDAIGLDPGLLYEIDDRRPPVADPPASETVPEPADADSS